VVTVRRARKDAIGGVKAKIAFVTTHHLVIESALGLTASNSSREYDGPLPGCSRIHHDERRHIGHGVWYLRQAAARTLELAEDPADHFRCALAVAGRRRAGPR
jgi:hypothetical protein